MLSLATRPWGQPVPLALQLDSLTFQPADASQVALFFNTYGSLYHIRKFSIKVKNNAPKVKSSDTEDDDDDSDMEGSDMDDTAKVNTAKFAAVEEDPTRLSTSEQIEPYIIAINNLPFLEEISFAGVSIGIWAAYRLAEALRTKTRLRRVDLSNCFKGRGASEIAPTLDALVSAFLELPNLESVDLSENALGPEVEWPILRLIRSHTPLQVLGINNAGMGPETGVEFAKALVTLASKKAAAGAPPLRELHYNRNKMIQDDDDPMFGMAEWAAAFAAHPNLRVLDLKGNRVQHAGMDRLVADGLSRLREIEVLDLQDNTFTSRGSTHRALADAVGGWPELRELNLNDSLLGSRGAALLIPALAAVQPSRLESLKLRANNLNPANTLALSGVLWRLPELREVNLRRNNIARDDEGYGILSRLLRERAEQREVQTTLNPIPRSPASAPSQSPRSSQESPKSAQQSSP